ncbi:MAG: 23S rRNA (pseudouridine(1915)-N(3))-methyltransferase RlmH [Flavobacteriales bacterium]|nr:23S rRNA (pseudouridine(1915)-N(3))-methyltransferase RlmH [Flavobacteriales bacterium]
MKVKLITVGKTDDVYIKEGVNKYVLRLKHYINYKEEAILDVKTGKKLNELIQKESEGKEILKLISKSDFVVLLDEKGKEFNSVGFSQFVQKRMNTGMNLTFIIGGPFGFSDEVYAQSNMKIALSQMTFSHQMVRLFFTEQLYRSLSILKGEKYHHV